MVNQNTLIDGYFESLVDDNAFWKTSQEEQERIKKIVTELTNTLNYE